MIIEMLWLLEAIEIATDGHGSVVGLTPPEIANQCSIDRNSKMQDIHIL